MKRIFVILPLAFAISGCATADWSFLTFFGRQSGGSVQRSVASEPMLALEGYRSKGLVYATEFEWLAEFVAVAQPVTRIQVDIGRGWTVVTTVEKSFTSALGRTCKQVRFEPDRSAFSQLGFDVVFCRGRTGWEPVAPLRKVDFSRMGMNRILKYGQDEAREQ